MVIKFNPEGRVVMVLGRRPEAIEGLVAPAAGAPPPPAEQYVFSRPTDVGWDAAGNIFVTDGYGNSRVVKYDKNGRFLKEAGTRGDKPGQLNLPHTMAMDAQGNVYVGDRSNTRVQVFDNDLNVKAIYDNVGSPWAVCISPGPHQYLFVSNSIPDNGLAQYRDITGEIYKMELDGTIVGRVRQGRQAARRVQHGARNRLPKPQRAAGVGNHVVAGPEDRAGPQPARPHRQRSRAPVMRFAGRAIIALPRCLRRPALPRRRRFPRSRSTRRPIVLKMPADVYLGEVAGVASSAAGHLFVYTRTGNPTVGSGQLPVVQSRRIPALRVRPERRVRA